MLVCGVELVGKEAIISLLRLKDDMFNLPDCRAKRVQCVDVDSSSELRYFQKTFAKLIEDYKIDHVIIRERQKKGKFAGGADGFKLEATLQLLEGVEVSLLSPTDQKAALKRYPMPIEFSETGQKKFQEVAYTAAFSYFAANYEW